MKPDLSDSMADYGFFFFEKLASPMFLISRAGSLKKVNEAGRKFLCVTHPTREQLKTIIMHLIQQDRHVRSLDSRRILTRKRQLRVLSKPLPHSEYLLVEIKG